MALDAWQESPSHSNPPHNPCALLQRTPLALKDLQQLFEVPRAAGRSTRAATAADDSTSDESSGEGEPSGEGGVDARRQLGLDGRPSRLTADEIKAKYGRERKDKGKARQTDAEGAAAVMGENRDKLLERGEKLGRLEEKMDRMVQDSMDFADAARKLKEQQEAPGKFFSKLFG